MTGSHGAGYVYGIDLVRFSAALLVALFHLTWQSAEASAWMPVGWVGVQIFFVISGFVIMASINGRSGATFARGRFLRLYPAAWCAAPIVLLCAYALPAAYETFNIEVRADLPAVRGAFSLLWGPFPASAYWTLPIELAFYALVFLLILIGWIERTRLLAITLTTLCAAYQALLLLHVIGIVDAPWVDFHYGPLNMTLMRHGCYFALGIFVWLMKVRRLGSLGAAFMTLALLVSLVEIHCRAVELAPKFAQLDGIERLSSGALAAASAAVFSIALAGIVVASRFSDRVPTSPGIRGAIRGAGLVTYPFYLVHEAVGGAILYRSVNAGLAFPGALAIALVATGVVSWGVVRVGEPLLRRGLGALIDRVVNPHRAAS